MKEFIEFIKELWNNKRTRSLAILIIYLIFFIFVFMFLNLSSKPTISNDPFGYLKSSDNYFLTFEAPHNFKVQGDIIKYNDVDYDINNKPLELEIYDINMFKPLNIYNLIKESNLESTNYVNSSNTYVISCKQFEKIIYSNDIESDCNIRITIYENNKDIIEIDLKEYLNYKVIMELRS